MTDQTQFIEQEPLLEDVWRPPVEPSAPKEKTKLQQLLQQHKILVGVGSSVLVALILLLMTFGSGSTPRNTDLLPDASAEPAPVGSQTTLQRRLSEVKASLKAADPAQDLLPFPPVAKTLTLEEETGR